ncbi:hypothetical protein [Streptomyces sp. I6]|uniref:hypothetical protein n=1 Tax=Streptomyces sp. I6 TaxID=2483113 RepID=UPI0028804AEB|nr:hypothetical protein [Streptomyces sp. I6]
MHRRTTACAQGVVVAEVRAPARAQSSKWRSASSARSGCPSRTAASTWSAAVDRESQMYRSGPGGGGVSRFRAESKSPSPRSSRTPAQSTPVHSAPGVSSASSRTRWASPSMAAIRARTAASRASRWRIPVSRAISSASVTVASASRWRPARTWFWARTSRAYGSSPMNPWERHHRTSVEARSSAASSSPRIVPQLSASIRTACSSTSRVSGASSRCSRNRASSGSPCSASSSQSRPSPSTSGSVQPPAASRAPAALTVSPSPASQP